MDNHISEYTFAEAWQVLLGKLILSGRIVSPREMKTKEIMNVTLEVEHGLENILYNPVRNLNYRFMIAEWLWIQAGLKDVASLARYNSVMQNFSDDGQILNGAYGPRLHTQWRYIYKSLERLDTRQAIATIWIPNPADSKDIPCTISLQWMIRNSMLHCTINMRSSDIWLGLPYDFFNFSQLTNMISANVQIPVGTITMNLASSHIYERDLDKGAEAMFDTNYESIQSPPLTVDGPSTSETVDILAQVEREYDIDNLWGKYVFALKHNSAHALEVLRSLDPCQG